MQHIKFLLEARALRLQRRAETANTLLDVGISGLLLDTERKKRQRKGVGGMKGATEKDRGIKMDKILSFHRG